MYRQTVVDFIRYHTYTPTKDALVLADSSDMTQAGRYVFYVSKPTVDDKKGFNEHCRDQHEERTVVLGCYKEQKIFVYNITDQRLYGVEEVTAAHEMLHAAYERMPQSEKLAVNKMLQEELTRITDKKLRETAEAYSRQHASQVWDELHSIIGTEYGSLAPDLEVHYKKYFADRNKVVALAAAYEGVFTTSKQRLKALDDELATVKGQIDTIATDLSGYKAQLTQESARLNELRTSNPQAFVAAVPAYNALVTAHNDLIVRQRSLIASYNSLVERRNAEAVANNDLYESLDSQVQTLPKT